MQYTKVHITRDETVSMTVHVGAWEVPLLEAKHSNEKMVVGETVDFPDRPWPESAEGEMQRLNVLYGRTGAGDDALTFAERVYGTGSVGVKNLDRAIAEALETAKPKGRKAKGGADLVGDAKTG